MNYVRNYHIMEVAEECQYCSSSCRLYEYVVKGNDKKKISANCFICWCRKKNKTKECHTPDKELNNKKE